MTMKTNRSIFTAISILGICSASYATQIFDTGSNGSLATAINLDPYFSSEFVANITSSTTVPHATATRTFGGATQYDWFSFSATSGSSILLDVDNGMFDFDPYLRVYDSGSSSITANDDGHAGDLGSAHGYDSYLPFTATYTGLYFVEVSVYVHGMIGAGQNYDLHVSVQDHVAPGVPDSASSALLCGLGLLSLLGFRARSKRA